MTYTKEAPREPGWYWFRNTDCELIVRVFAIKEDLFVNEKAVHAFGPYGSISNVRGFWAGPLQAPQ